MSKDYPALTRQINEYVAELHKEVPEALKGFSELAKGATQDGALDLKTKELIALAIGVAKQCDGCIGFHVKKLHQLGTSRGEISEVLAMAVYMGGGPALMYAADALRAYDQFAQS